MTGKGIELECLTQSLKLILKCLYHFMNFHVI